MLKGIVAIMGRQNAFFILLEFDEKFFPAVFRLWEVWKLPHPMRERRFLIIRFKVGVIWTLVYVGHGNL